MRINDRLQLNLPLRAGRASAPGKVILFGEHFVVHGATALALPAAQRVTVAVAPRVADTPSTDSVPWRCHPNGVEHLKRMLVYLGIAPDDVHLAVSGDLPIGAGMGSSAALAVALVRALGVSDVERVRQVAHALEGLAHGSPSGIDDAVAALAKPLLFRRGAPPQALSVRFDVPVWIALTPCLASTREAVEHVGLWRQQHQARFDALMTRSDELALGASASFGKADVLGRMMDEAHGLLAELGLSTPALESVAAAARREGAFGAKITGAGMGGALLVAAPCGLDLGPALADAGALRVLRPFGVATNAVGSDA